MTFDTLRLNLTYDPLDKQNSSLLLRKSRSHGTKKSSIFELFGAPITQFHTANSIFQSFLHKTSSICRNSLFYFTQDLVFLDSAMKIFRLRRNLVTKASEREYLPKTIQNAKKSNYLTFSTIWAHSSGNVNISPWITRLESGINMVKCFR